MKIAILNGGCKLYYKNKDEYTIKTTIGNFTDVNEVIKKYPNVKESKYVRKCKWCGRYFITIGNRSNKRKYCSDNCSHKAKNSITMDSYYKSLIINYGENPADKYKYSMNDWAKGEELGKGTEYKHDDRNWGLGTGNLTGKKANNFKSEYRIIKNELKRLKLRK